MKHLFIPYELAVLAKEKGFNEPCIAVFSGNKDIYSLSNPTSDFSTVLNQAHSFSISAPLYQQIIDWFRNNHRFFIKIEQHQFSLWYFKLEHETINQYNINNIIDNNFGFDSYYKALNKAIGEALKII